MRRAGDPVSSLLAFELDASSGVPLYRQLYERVRAAILSGELRQGAALPSSRAVVADLRLARSTVVNAYELLLAEGLTVGRAGSGTYVASEPAAIAAGEHALQSAPAAQDPPRRVPGNHPRRGGFAHAAWAVAGDEVDPPRAFRDDAPDLRLFPRWTWSRVAAHCYRSLAEEHLDHADVAGSLPLREAVARYLTTTRMTSCTPEQVIITSGAQQALDLVARVLVTPGQALWVEDPGSARVRRLFTDAGARLIPVPVDAEGMVLSEGMRAAPDCRIAYVTPTHQYPLGVSLSPSRRLGLVEWAASERGWIIERDFESEYRFGARTTASAQGLDTNGRTVLVGSFSKVMFPALRLGYLVAPDALLASLLSARRRSGSQPSTMQQVILTEFIAGGHFASHIRRTRTVYARRRAALAEALRHDLGDKVEVQVPHGGLRLIVRLAAHLDDRAITRMAGERGIDVSSLSSHSQLATDRGLLLGFACAEEDTLRAGSKCLARVLGAFPDGSRAGP